MNILQRRTSPTHWPILAFYLWFFTTSLLGHLAFADEVIKLGVLAHRGTDKAVSMWTPTARYLESVLPGYRFQIIPLDNDSIVTAVDTKEVNFVITHPASFASLEENFGVSRIATLRNRRFDGAYTTFGAVIFTRVDSDIHKLEDLEDRRFAAVHPDAFGGWWMAWRELQDKGIDPETDFTSLEFTGFPQDQIVTAVREGKADAGTVRTDTLEHMSAMGLAKMSEFRILNAQTVGVDTLPFVRSTRLYPEWPFAVLRHTSPDLATQVTIALLQMPKNNAAALSASSAGWTVPLDYSTVHELMRELGVGPYQNFGQMTLTDIVQLYWPWLLSFTLAFIALAMATSYVLALNRNLRQAIAARNAEKLKAQSTLASLGDAVITTNTKEQVEYINPSAEALTGWSLQEAEGQTFNEVVQLLDSSNGEPITDLLRNSTSGNTAGKRGHKLMILSRSGDKTSVEEIVAPRSNGHNGVAGAVVALRDVNELRRLEQEMAYRATHDDLTGLLNRREFEQILANALHSSQVEGKEHTLLFLDLDQFKVVNDSCGHSAGDQLLVDITKCLGDMLRGSDSLARLGGDEFGILLIGCDKNDAKFIAEKLCQKVKSYRFYWQEQIFQVGVSIGIAPLLSADINSTAEATRAADAACYQAKESGRNRVYTYQENDQTLRQRKGEVKWLQTLKRALEEDHFVIYGQPIMPITNAPPLIEVLLRMVADDGSLIAPGLFLPAAERYRLMEEVDQWVIKRSLAMIAKQDSEHPMLSINLSGQSFSHPRFLNFLVDAIDGSGVPPERLCFEITETTAIANFVQAQQLINILKGMGCHFALDDFGSGMSSFSYLKKLPVDYLKIDGSFVKNMHLDQRDYAMVEAINNLGHVMGMKTVAEFVENDEIHQCLQRLHVDFAQGYGIAKPAPLENFLSTSVVHSTTA